jgi:hypothetical protein
MSAHTGTRPEPWSWLPPPLRPRASERAGSGELRLVETTLLVIAALLLATATVNDVARQVGVEHRLSADLRTWRLHTGLQYRNLTADQQLLGTSSEREVVCGNTRPGPPRSSLQLCLEIWGPVERGVRQVHGGWYLAAHSDDVAARRSGCFGDAVAEALCPH